MICIKKIGEMQTAAGTFISNPTQTSLQELKTAFQTAWLSWQNAAQYEFGPAEEVFLRNSLNNFPADTEQIDDNIASGSYDFDQPDDYDKGFPALDYLLHGLAQNDAATIDQFSNASGEPYRTYLTAIITDMLERVTHTRDAWINGYKQTFLENTGTAAGTSLSLIINGLNHNFELIKREKIGIPAGVLTSGFTNPDRVEAFYGGSSLALAVAALEASKSLFLGRNVTGNNGTGLDDYLSAANVKKRRATFGGSHQKSIRCHYWACRRLRCTAFQCS